MLAGLIGLRPGTGGTEVRLPISSGFFTWANFYVKDALGYDLLTGYRVMDDRFRLCVYFYAITKGEIDPLSGGEHLYRLLTFLLDLSVCVLSIL